MNGWHLLPPAASANAHDIDHLFWALVGLLAFFAVPIFALLIAFTLKYRNGRRTNRSNPPRTNLPLEIAWTLTPTLIGLGFFMWAAQMYFANATPPADALDVYVVGKQWMWKLQHPNGRREIDELHVPAGRDVKLTLTSEDVIHSFFVPAFRLKQDAVPGRYTTLWFKPTRVGKYHLFCAEYCGTFHSRMGGWVTVMKPEDYARWLQEGDAQPTMVQAGEKLFAQLGCSGCHGANSTVRAPLLDGIYNQPVAIQAGGSTPTGSTQVVTADEAYLRDSIILPGKDIAAGYQNIMPTFKGKISEEQLLQLIAYLKVLRHAAAPQTPRAPNNGKTGDAAKRDYMRSWAGRAKRGVNASR